MKRIFRFALAWFSLAFLALVLTSSWLGYRVAERAKAFLDSLAALEVNSSDFASAKRLANEYEEAILTVDANCSPEECRWSFLFENRIFSFLGLAPSTTLAAELYVAENKLQFREAGLTCHSPNFGYNATVTERNRQGPDGEPYKVRVESDSLVTVYLYSGATAEQRDTFRHLNARCLRMLRGCPSTNQLLPLKSL